MIKYTEFTLEYPSRNKIKLERGIIMSITEQLAATHLGKKSVGSELYDKTLLVAVPRSENRQQCGISRRLSDDRI